MEKIIHITLRSLDEITPLQQDVIDTARRLHPGWEIKIWTDPEPGKEPDFRLKRYWSRTNSGAQLADLLRLEILFWHGGVYLDSDLRLFRTLDQLVETYDFFIASEDGYSLTNAVIGACKGSPVLERLIDRLDRNEPDWASLPHLTTGPVFFSMNLKWDRTVSV